MDCHWRLCHCLLWLWPTVGKCRQFSVICRWKCRATGKELLWSWCNKYISYRQIYSFWQQYLLLDGQAVPRRIKGAHSTCSCISGVGESRNMKMETKEWRKNGEGEGDREGKRRRRGRRKEVNLTYTLSSYVLATHLVVCKCKSVWFYKNPLVFETSSLQKLMTHRIKYISSR